MADTIEIYGFGTANNAPAANVDNEFEFINESIMYYINNNKALQEKVYSQMPIIENSFFRKLLKGQNMAKQDINDMLEFLDIECTSEKYGVLIVQLDSNLDFGGSQTQPIREVAKVAICNVVDKAIDDKYWRFIVEEDYEQLDIILGFDKNRQT